MSSPKPDRPYFEAWLKRAGRQLAASGRLSQIAMVMSSEQGGSPEHWRQLLHRMLRGDHTPTLEEITRIDHLLAAPSPASPHQDSQQELLF